jgi:hypothetical protein
MNAEIAMNQKGGTKGKPHVEKMLNVFDLHFSTPAEKAMSRIYATKTERNLHIFGWCWQFKQSCPWATLSYFCLQNKAGKINAMRRVVLRKMIQKSSAFIHLQIEFTTFAAKKPQPLCETWIKKGTGEKGMCGHRLIMDSITHRGGECEREGGGAAPLHRLYISQVKCKRCDNMRNT